MYPRLSMRQSVLTVALGCASVPVAFADDTAAVPATDLDQVVVTATRTAQTQDGTLAAISVITRDDIERLQPASLPDLLRGTPGLLLSNNGGPGKATSVFLRGTESDHVLVLVDGIKIGSATSGVASLQDIPVEQIERVEIVRGPFSSLYGSEAIGGVIQIFTRRPQAPFAPSFSAGFGSHERWRTAAGIAGRSDASDGNGGWYSVDAAHEQTEGINACRGYGSPIFAGCFTNEPDHDGYRNESVSAQGGYRFNDAWDAAANVLRVDGDNEYDGSFNNESDFVGQVAGARLRYRPLHTVAITLNLGRSADFSDSFKNGRFTGSFETRRSLGSLQADIGAGDGLVSVGFDWQRDEVGGTTDYAVDERIDRSVFGQWQQGFAAHALQVSLRRDEDSQFGGKTTGSALWGWDFTRALRLTASYGTAYKAPTFNELYYPGFGNPALTPENSRSIELGLRGEHGWGDWSLNAFDMKIDDLIAFDATLPPFGGPNNIDSALIHGVEATFDTDVAGWSLQGSATWLDPRNESNGRNHGNILPRRARESARIDLDRRFVDLSVGASVYAASERFDDLVNKRRMGGYATADLRFAYALTAAWSVQLSVSNMFDRQYETAAFYNQPGREYFLGVRFSAR